MGPILLCVLLVLILAGAALTVGVGGRYTDAQGHYAKIKGTHSFSHAINHPAFEGFGECASPFAKNTFVYRVTKPLRISYLCRCLGFDPDAVVDGMNFMIDRKTADALKVFYLYSPEEQKADVGKQAAKLIYLPGKRLDAPTALVLAGGGLDAVVMMQEGFPIAQRLHEAGYAVFLLKYRVGAYPSENKAENANAKLSRATEDCSRAVQLMFEKAASLGYSVENYSMWGFSAGGRVIMHKTLQTRYSLRDEGLPLPAMISIAYALPDVEEMILDEKTPAVYLTLGEKDSYYPGGIARARTLGQRLREHGISVIERYYEEDRAMGHGFGRGDGTFAAGWMNDAIGLWKEQMNT